MPQELRYGCGSTLQLELADGVVRADFSRPRAEPLDDPVAAVVMALSEPLNFPPLAQAVVPGDQIAIAVDLEVPQCDAVVAGVIAALLEGGASPSDISLVVARSPDQADTELPTKLLADDVRLALRVVEHDPADPTNLMYLAASKEGKAIYVNRAIGDADVVVPIGALRLDASLGYCGIHGGLFPAFSDEKTQQRFRTPSNKDGPSHQRRLRDEADETAWLLGALFTVQVVPGPGNSLLHVLAGDASAVLQRGRKLCEAAWLCRISEPADLVVATIEGGPEQQTWDNFARALFAASQAVANDGAIVLCTNLKCGPGPALQRLLSVEDKESTLRELRRDRTSDAIPARLLLEAQGRARVFLLSDLNGELVEEMGMGHISSAHEIDRLSGQYQSCILVGNAHHAVLTTRESN